MISLNQMNPEPDTVLKEKVKEFWERQSCDTDQAQSTKFSREYFEEVERWRYAHQPFIHSFAQFTRYRGKKVLEVGFGAGTDFIQWLRAGALASGIDLTQEAENLSHRIQIYNLPPLPRASGSPTRELPFPPINSISDLVRRSPSLANTNRTVENWSGHPSRWRMKMMLCNRRSIAVFNVWVKHALLRGIRKASVGPLAPHGSVGFQRNFW